MRLSNDHRSVLPAYMEQQGADKSRLRLAGSSCLVLCLLLSVCSFEASTQPAETIQFSNGRWFNGQLFERKTAYAIGGVLSFHRPAYVHRSIDLHGGFVVPPFGEAHNHNVESLNNLDALIAKYLLHGIFYVKNPNNLARDRGLLQAKLNRPDSIDVAFSNGSFTGSGGHPVEIPQRVIRTGKWTNADGEGGFYYAVNNDAELDEKWPALLATRPDFVKTYLLYSDQYQRRRFDPHFDFWKGLDPALLPVIVKKAHEAGLRVSTHIENAADFHNALVAGVDEINHMPGFRYGSDVEPHPVTEFEISAADARAAARQETYVVSTLGGATQQSDPALRQRQDALNIRNLALLLKYHVKIALGSDAYRFDTLPEALYLDSLHVMAPRTLLNAWCTTTPETIFPGRHIGHLKEGYEASFLVLRGNPLVDFAMVEQITLEVKQGHVLDAQEPKGRNISPQNRD